MHGIVDSVEKHEQKRLSKRLPFCVFDRGYGYTKYYKMVLNCIEGQLEINKEHLILIT